MERRPSLSLLVTVALVSAAVLTFEISLTRIFAVLLRYHFAFLVISVALCGLGVGGYLTYWLQRGKRTAKVLSPTWLLLGFAIGIDVALALMLRVVFAHIPTAYWLAAVLILIPFTFAGMYLAMVFTRHAAWSGKLYSWDLAGAALAAFFVILLLELVSAIDACLFVAAVCALAAFVLERRKNASIFALGVTVILFGIAFANRSQLWLDIPPIPPGYNQNELKFGIANSLADRGITQPLFTELGTPGHSSKIVDTRWNSFARTDVVVDNSMPGSYYLYTNGNVPTNMMEWDGKLSSIEPITGLFPLNDWVFAQAPLGNHGKPAGKVLSIGPGGGLDALLALHHNAAKIDGAEINPSIVKLMKEPYYANFNGHLYTNPRVHISVAEGRAFVREAVAHDRHYQLLYSALTKTATASQGMALLESFVYTTDAFQDYLNAISDDGQIAVVMDDPLLLARFYTTALQTLMGQNLTAITAAQHIAIVQNTTPGPYVFAIVISKQMLTRQQTFAMEDSAIKDNLHPLWIPDQASSTDYGPFPSVGTGQMDLPGFINWYRAQQTPLDVTPCPDSRPFVMDLSIGILPVYKQLTAVALVLALLLTGLGWIDRRNLHMAEAAPDAVPLTPARSGAFVLYFLALGVGFMLVEIPLLQQLILTLGYPTLSITVILFSLLLGGGIGARFSQRFDAARLLRWAMTSALLVAVITAAATFLLPTVQNSLLALPILGRCAVIAISLLPLGFFLGAPFPCGLRLFDRNGGVSFIPLMWGINGVASVIGSLCAAMGAKLWGFPMMLNLGELIYLVAAGLLWFTEERAAEGSSTASTTTAVP
jgi:spermidine synthase